MSENQPAEKSESQGEKDESENIQDAHQSLLHQNRVLAGKIRGYQTLSQLFHDSRRKCSEQEKELKTLREVVETLRNGDLSDSVPVMEDSRGTDDGDGSGRDPDPALSPDAPTSRAGRSSGSSFDILSNSPTDSQPPSQPSSRPSAQPVTSGEEGEAGSGDQSFALPAAQGAGVMQQSSVVSHAAGSSLTSSASRSGTLTLAPSVHPSDAASSRYGFISEQSARVHGHASPAALDVDHMSNALFEAVGVDPALLNDSALAVEVTRCAAKVLKLEKNNQIMETLIESLTKENGRLKNRIASAIPEKDQTIASLKQENAKFLEKIRKLEKERNHASPTPSLHSQPPTSFEPEGAGSKAGSELMAASVLEGEAQGWVAVDKKEDDKASDTSSRGQPFKDETKDIPRDREAYEQKVSKYERRIQKLQEANRAWDEHCQRLEVQCQEQLRAAAGEVSAQREALSECQRQADGRQQELLDECDQLRQKHKHEEEDLQLLLADARRRAEEQQAVGERARAKGMELELQITELQATVESQQDVIDALNSDMRSIRVNSNPLECRPPPRHGRWEELTRAELLSTVEVLEAQVTVYKEDFTKERDDRARAQAEKDAVLAKLKRKQSDLHKRNRELSKAQLELDHTNRDNEVLKRRLTQKTDAYNQLERQLHHRSPPLADLPPLPGSHRPSSWATSPSAGYVNAAYQNSTQLVGPPPPPQLARPRLPSAPMSHILGDATWSCQVCTYENQHHLDACDMCGEPNPLGRRLHADHMQYSRQRMIPRGWEECDGEPLSATSTSPLLPDTKAKP